MLFSEPISPMLLQTFIDMTKNHRLEERLGASSANLQPRGKGGGTNSPKAMGASTRDFNGLWVTSVVLSCQLKLQDSVT